MATQSLIKKYKNLTEKEISNDILNELIAQYELNKSLEEQTTLELINSGEIMRVLINYRNKQSGNYFEKIQIYNNNINRMLAEGYKGYDHRNFLGYNNSNYKKTLIEQIYQERIKQANTNTKISAVSLPTGILAGALIALLYKGSENISETSIELGVGAGIVLGVGMYALSRKLEKSNSRDFNDALDKFDKAYDIAKEKIAIYARAHPFMLLKDAENNFYLKNATYIDENQENNEMIQKEQTR